MSPAGTVTRWVGDLKAGDEEAARKLWELYFGRLVCLARGKLRGARQVRAVKDEEDVALSALNRVLVGAAQGRYPDLDDRGALWRLLAVITARKASNQVRDARRLKRGGPDGPDASAFLAEAVGPEPSPEFAALMAEEYRLRVEGLGDLTLQRVARWRMEGYDLEEIGARLGCGTRTVRRKLERIRREWLGEDPS
jgi:DNA-directed RNA polymerase specialized sigma24 family protein